MKCKNCGHEMIDGVYRCMNCGAFAPDPFADSDADDGELIEDKIKNPAVQSVSKTRNQTDPMKILKPIIAVLCCVIVVCSVTLAVMFRPTSASAGGKNDTQTTQPNGQSTQSGNQQDQQQAIADAHLQQAQQNSPEYIAYSCNGFVAMLANSFYLDCTLIDSSSGRTPFSIAVSNGNTEVLYDMDGMQIAMMNMGNSTYLINPTKKTYVNASKALMSAIGMDSEDLDLNMMWPNGDTVFKFTEEQYNGKDAVCAEYSDADGVITKIYISDGNVVSIDSCDSSGTAVSRMEVNELTGTIPSTMLTLDGMSSVGIIDFVTNLMT